MKPLLIISILFAPIFLFSQNDERKQLIDLNHQINFSINSKIKHNNNSSKLYYWYKFQKIIVTQGYYPENPLNGLFIKFYTNNNLCEKGYFHYGLKNKQWLSWAENGEIISIENYKKGTKKGIQKYYQNSELIKVEKINFWRIKTIQQDSSFLINKIFKTKKVIKNLSLKNTI